MTWLLEPLISKSGRLDLTESFLFFLFFFVSFFVCLLKKQAHGHRGFSGFGNEELNDYGAMYCTRMAGGVRGSRCLGTEGSAGLKLRKCLTPC